VKKALYKTALNKSGWPFLPCPGCEGDLRMFDGSLKTSVSRYAISEHLTMRWLCLLFLVSPHNDQPHLGDVDFGSRKFSAALVIDRSLFDRAVKHVVFRQLFEAILDLGDVIDVDRKKRKVIKRQGPKVAANQPPLVITPIAASGNSAATVPPTKLSFMDIISGRLARNLLNLN
jgi:hypothetical protein